MTIHQQLSNSMVVGAFNYAMADRSDPFSYSRAMSHVKNGICDPKFQNGQRLDCHYEADKTTETLPNGYKQTTYINMKRP